MHTSQYPILAELATDILVVLVSTVASESAFSAGGRFLNPHCSKLLPDTLEASMCAQNWIWASTSRDIKLYELYFSSIYLLKML